MRVRVVQWCPTHHRSYVLLIEDERYGDMIKGKAIDCSRLKKHFGWKPCDQKGFCWLKSKEIETKVDNTEWVTAKNE